MQNRSVPAIVAVLTAGLAAVYLVPYLVPVRDGLSFSYLFGFSNRTAIVLLAGLTIGFALWTRGLGLTLPDPSDRSPSPFRLTFYVTLACSILGCILTWLYASTIIPLAESQYFLDRYEMFRQGARLYRDFEFDYGPLLFYFPVLLSRVFSLSLFNAYFIAWILQYALGVWVLWKTVVLAARGTPHGRAIYLLFWAFFALSLIDSGPNYTPLRFAGTLLGALAVHALYTRGASYLATFLLASAAASALLFYSPEQGIVFTVGTLLFFLLCVNPRRPGTLAGLGLFIAIMALVFYLANRVGVLDNIRTVGGGVLNFPILFSFQTMVVLLLLIAAGSVAMASFRTRTSGHALLYLICLSVVCSPAALSRADVGHMIVNTLGALIATLVVLSRYGAIWRWVCLSFAIVLLLSSYAHTKFYVGTLPEQVKAAVFDARIHSPVAEKIYVAVATHLLGATPAHIEEKRKKYADPTDPHAPRLPREAHLMAPMGVVRRIELYPGDPQIVTGRYPWLFPMTSTAMLGEKIAELDAHPDWPILLQNDGPFCVEDPGEVRQGMKALLFVPYMPHPRHLIEAAVPFCNYLKTHYRIGDDASPVPGYSIWFRR